MKERHFFQIGCIVAILVTWTIMAGIEQVQPQWGKGEIDSYSNDTRWLYKVDPTTCAETQISSFGLTGVDSLTFNPTGTPPETFGYLFDESTFKLYSIDISNPAVPIVTAKGTCPYDFPGIASCKDGYLYGIATSTVDKLFRIDPNNCNSTPIGSGLGVSLGNRDLTCHPTSDVLYAFGSNTDTLYTIDKSSGLATPVGRIGVDIQGGVGLAFDRISGKLYASLDQNNNGTFGLWELNPSTGQGTFLCNLPHGWCPNLV